VSECRKRRVEAQQKEQAAQALLEMSAQQEQTTSEKPTSSTMTELTGDYITNLETECVRLHKENSELRIEMESYQLSENDFKDGDDDDDAKVNYFTGLPSYKALMAVFEFVSPCIEDSHSTLPKFQQFLLVLMKVRFNLDNQLLAFKFGIHVSTVSRCFHKLLNVMYERLKPLVMWPDRFFFYEISCESKGYKIAWLILIAP